MVITSIHHIHLKFPLHFKEEIRFFYATVLKTPELRSSEKKQLLQFEIGAQLLCFTPETSVPARKSAQHVAFNVQDIDKLKMQLHHFDLPFIERHHPSLPKQIYIKDPAGNQLEFLEIRH